MSRFVPTPTSWMVGSWNILVESKKKYYCPPQWNRMMFMIKKINWDSNAAIVCFHVTHDIRDINLIANLICMFSLPTWPLFFHIMSYITISYLYLEVLKNSSALWTYNKDKLLLHILSFGGNQAPNTECLNKLGTTLSSILNSQKQLGTHSKTTTIFLY